MLFYHVTKELLREDFWDYYQGQGKNWGVPGTIPEAIAEHKS